MSLQGVPGLAYLMVTYKIMILRLRYLIPAQDNRWITCHIDFLLLNYIIVVVVVVVVAKTAKMKKRPSF